VPVLFFELLRKRLLMLSIFGLQYHKWLSV